MKKVKNALKTLRLLCATAFILGANFANAACPNSIAKAFGGKKFGGELNAEYAVLAPIGKTLFYAVFNATGSSATAKSLNDRNPMGINFTVTVQSFDTASCIARITADSQNGVLIFSNNAANIDALWSYSDGTVYKVKAQVQ